MTILFFGAELGHFNPSIAVYSTSYRDANYARASIHLHGAATLDADFTPGPEIYSKAHLAVVSSASTANMQLFAMRGAALGSICRMAVSSTRWVNIQYWSGSAWVTMRNYLMPDGFYTVAWHIKIGVSGWIKCYINNELNSEFIGNTSHLPQPGNILFSPPTNSSVARATYVSEVAVADHDVRRARVKTLDPTGNGAHTAWTNGFANVDGYAQDDANYVASSTAGAKETFTHSGLPADGLLPEGVRLDTRALRGVTGPQNIDSIVHVGGIDYAQNLGVLDTVPLDFNQQRLVSPNTGVAWTRAEINAMQFGVEAKA